MRKRSRGEEGGAGRRGGPVSRKNGKDKVASYTTLIFMLFLSKGTIFTLVE